MIVTDLDGMIHKPITEKIGTWWSYAGHVLGALDSNTELHFCSKSGIVHINDINTS